MTDATHRAANTPRSEPPIGCHCILELYGCPAQLLDDPDAVLAAMQDAAALAQATLLEHLVHRFSPQGVTALGLLSESHIAIHTWPEVGYVACDIFTCGAHTEPERACQALAQAFCATRSRLQRLARGGGDLVSREGADVPSTVV